MAKRATAKRTIAKGGKTKARSKPLARAKSPAGSRRSGGGSQDMGDAFIKLLQSPLVAELVAVAATAALAALAEQGFSSRGGEGATPGNRAGKAVKAAGKAAAAAVGRRLTTEIDEIRKAAKSPKAGAKA